MTPLPSFRESRILLQALFDPFGLSPKDAAWIEERNRRQKEKAVETAKKRAIQSKGLVFRPTKQPKRNAAQRRLEREAAADGHFTLEEWENLKFRYDGQCLRCGDVEGQIVPDHIRPLYRKGSGLIENIQPLCSKCNIWKGLKIIDYRPGFAFEVV